MKTLMKKLITTVLAISMVVLLIPALAPVALAVTEINVTAPEGTAPYTFTVPIPVDFVGPYSGIYFDLAVSNTNSLKMASADGYVRSRASSIPELQADPRVVNASSVGFITPSERKDGLKDTYTFGFYTGSNAFSGSLNAGYVTITFSGSANASFTLYAHLAHFPDDGEQSSWIGPRIEHATVNITRAGSTPGNTETPGGFPTGNPDDPNIISLPPIIIEDEGTPQTGPISFPAFINGYTDGTFKGTRNMTRQEFAQILFKIKNPGELPTANPDDPSFADVKPGWSYDAIEWAVSANVVTVEEYFRPTAPITRAEVAEMLARAEAMTEVAENPFSDIDDHPARDYILKCAFKNIFEGYPDGTFKPDNPIKRNEVVAALVRYLLGGEPTDEMWENIEVKLSDVPRNWTYRYVALATNGYVEIPMEPEE